MKKAIIAVVLAGLLPSFAEKSNVFFIHGANVSEDEARVWADQMFKRLWQVGAQMEFIPIAWESDIGPSWNYHQNVSNAFVMAARIAPIIPLKVVKPPAIRLRMRFVRLSFMRRKTPSAAIIR